MLKQTDISRLFHIGKTNDTVLISDFDTPHD
jgi:hypothetical protein